MIINSVEELFIAVEYQQYQEITDINLRGIISDRRFFDVCHCLPKFNKATKVAISQNDFSAIEDCVERWRLLWKAIRTMRNIKSLHFCNNVLVEFNLEEWEELKLSMQLLNLEEINLSNNNLGYFGNDHNLNIWKTIWEGIVSCKSLATLSLKGNSIHKISTSACTIVESLVHNSLNLLSAIDLFNDVEKKQGQQQKTLYNILAKKLASSDTKNPDLNLSFSLLF